MLILTSVSRPLMPEQVTNSTGMWLTMERTLQVISQLRKLSMPPFKMETAVAKSVAIPLFKEPLYIFR